MKNKGNKGDNASFYKKLKPEFWLVLIILFSIIIRIIFFTGYSLIDGDDSIYIHLMNSINNNNLRYDHYANIINEDKVNPIAAFDLRSMMIYPPAYIQKLFGVNDFSAVFFVFLSSIGSVIVVYYLGKLFFNVEIGLLAAFLMGFMPLEVLYSSQIMPDVEVAFFMGLSVLLFFLGEKRKKQRKKSFILFFFSGLSLGIGYLTKITAIVIIPLLLLYCLYRLIFKKEFNSYWLIFIGVFLLIFFAENIFYYSQTGEFFLRPRVMSKINYTKYLPGYRYDAIQYSIYPIIDLYHPRGFLFYFSRIVANTFHAKEIYVGFAYYLTGISLLSCCLGLLRNKFKNRMIYLYILIIWVISLFIFLEFGPAIISFNDPDSPSLISYKLVDKHPRYMTILSIPSIILVSAFFFSLTEFKFKKLRLGLYISLFLLVFLILSSFYHIYINTNFFRSSLHDLREVSSFLNNEDVKILYTDHLANGIIDYFSGFNRNFEIRLLSETPDPDVIFDSYVILGGSRGGIDYNYILEITPDIYEDYYYNIPSNWKLVKEVKGPINDNRKQNMRIFYVD